MRRRIVTLLQVASHEETLPNVSGEHDKLIAIRVRLVEGDVVTLPVVIVTEFYGEGIR
jgi:hypothetical protein